MAPVTKQLNIKVDELEQEVEALKKRYGDYDERAEEAKKETMEKFNELKQDETRLLALEEQMKAFFLQQKLMGEEYGKMAEAQE